MDEGNSSSHAKKATRSFAATERSSLSGCMTAREGAVEGGEEMRKGRVSSERGGEKRSMGGLGEGAEGWLVGRDRVCVFCLNWRCARAPALTPICNM